MEALRTLCRAFIKAAVGILRREEEWLGQRPNYLTFYTSTDAN